MCWFDGKPDERIKGSGRGDSEVIFYWDGETLMLNILGKPKGPQLKISAAAAPRAGRAGAGRGGAHQYRAAAPRAGRATDNMVRFLAEEFGVATGDIEVVFGRMNVNKKLRIQSPKRLPAIIAQQELA